VRFCVMPGERFEVKLEDFVAVRCDVLFGVSD
jgi:hypothetical protein